MALEFSLDLIEVNGVLYGRNHGNCRVVGVDGTAYGKNWNNEIPLGTVFNRVVKSTFIESNELTDETEVLIVQLQIKAVEYYRCSIECIPSGGAAKLLLVGQGLKEIGNLLQNLCSNDNIRLVV